MSNGPSLRWLVGSAFEASSTSITAVAWFAPIGVVTAVATMPLDVSRPLAWLIAIMAQLAFSLMVLLAGLITATGRSRTAMIAGSIVIAGAVRGVTIVIGAAWVSGTDVSPADILARAGNSAFVCLLALGVMGIVIHGTARFRQEYQLLVDRALRLEQDRAGRADALDANVVAQWVGIQRSLSRAAATSRQHLGRSDVDATDLQAAADLIGDVLEHDVRPVSHGLWQASAGAPPRLRRLHLAWAALRPWRPSVLLTALIYALLCVIGSVNRAGLIDGLLFAAYATLTVTLVLALTGWIGRLLPRSHAVGAIALLMLPIAVTGMAQILGQGVLRAPADPVGALVAGLTASILAAGLVLAQRVSIERDVLLSELQRRIDSQALCLLGGDDGPALWEHRLGTFVHHSVQSELTAMRLHLQSAALAADSQEHAQARTEALARFDRLLELAPPWEDQIHGRAVVDRVARAWEGIADIQCTLTQSGSGLQWDTVGGIVEEGVANAIRTGRARRVNVRVDGTEDGGLIVVIDDDGLGMDFTASPGMGTWWLDRIAPDRWHRARSGSGTRLTVHVT